MNQTEREMNAAASAGKKTWLPVVKRVVAAILLTVVVFSVSEIITYFEQQADAEQMQNDILNELVTPNENEADEDAAAEDETDAEAEDAAQDETDAEDESTDEADASGETAEEAQPAVSKAPVSTGGSAVQATAGSDSVSVDFDTLIARYPDVVGYIYGPDTKIQYPIAYDSSSNDYYLNRDLDGNLNVNGSIFIEYLCDPNFGNQNTLIYGHHMKSGLMFAGLCKYKDPSYYASHPYFYIYTPTQDYKVNLFAGFVCAHDDEVFALSLTQSQLEGMAAKSTFKSNIGTPTGKVVSLCTCSYEFNNARYVVVGELVPIN